MKYFITTLPFITDEGNSVILKVLRTCEDIDFDATKVTAADYLVNQATKENNWTTPTIDNVTYEEITLARWNALMNAPLDPTLYPTNFVEDFTIYTEANENINP